MGKNIFKVTLLLMSFFVLSDYIYATSEQIEHIKTGKNTSITPVSKLLEIELSIFQHLEKEFFFGQYICEEINVNGIPHHLSPVPGDNDCGLHAINAQYPHLKLTREGVLKRFSDIVADHENPFYNTVATELASSLVSELRKAVIDNIRNTVLPKENVFFQACTKDLFSDRNQFVLEAANNTSILNSYITFLKNRDVMLLDLSETIDLDRESAYMGTFGLVCQLYQCNIDLVNFSKSGDMPVYPFHFNVHVIESKKILFRSVHFSPLCEMDNEEERGRLAQHHIENVLIPCFSIYQKTSENPVPEGHLYADEDTIDAQMAQAIMESLVTANLIRESSPSMSASATLPKTSSFMQSKIEAEKRLSFLRTRPPRKNIREEINQLEFYLTQML